MNLGMGTQKQKGFTIVELLIVVVVIAILAAITIVAYNGIQNRAKESAVSSDLAQNSKTIMNAVNVQGGTYLTSSITATTLNNHQFDRSKYKVITYCSTASEGLLLVETTAGKKYYSKHGAAMVNNDAIDSFIPCPAAGISGAYTTYLNLPAQCAAENGTCTFSGTATVVYGSTAQGRFTRLLNQTSPVTCSNGVFTDPAPSFAKACFVYPN